MDDIGYQPTIAADQSRKNRPRGWLALATGLNLAVAVCYLNCTSPRTHTLSSTERLVTSIVYLLIACLVGAAGTRIILPRGSQRQFRALSRCALRGWVFLPATILFLQQRSILAPLIAAVSAALVSASLFRFTDLMPEDPLEKPRAQQPLDKDLFTSEVRLAPASSLPFSLSLCLYGALLSAIAGKFTLVTLLLAASASLLVVQILPLQPKQEQQPNQSIDRRSNPYAVIVVALFCAFLALSASPQVWQDPLLRWARRLSISNPARPRPTQTDSSSGYRTIVLWPIEKQQKVIPPPPRSINLAFPGIAKPWIIPFYGPYWYFKSPGESPGPNTRTARGDPLKVNVRSTDSSAVLMEAHQQLSASIDLACCREMQIVFRNDVSLGAVAVGLSLTDSHSKRKLSQSLGIRYVATDAAGRRPDDPVEETLIFPLPGAGLLKRFDAITVTLLSGARHPTAGRKVAVERFVMIPN
jgi:hypothetical protein